MKSENKKQGLVTEVVLWYFCWEYITGNETTVLLMWPQLTNWENSLLPMSSLLSLVSRTRLLGRVLSWLSLSSSTSRHTSRPKLAGRYSWRVVKRVRTRLKSNHFSREVLKNNESSGTLGKSREQQTRNVSLRKSSLSAMSCVKPSGRRKSGLTEASTLHSSRQPLMLSGIPLRSAAQVTSVLFSDADTVHETSVLFSDPWSVV